MKYYLILSIFFTIHLFAQDAAFNVEIIEPSKPPDGNAFYKIEHYTPYFFEDENYVVTTECRGEFGGAVYFKDKKSDIVTMAYATCPVIINKIGKRYYLTASLSHMGGSYALYEINNPKKMTVKPNERISLQRENKKYKKGMKVLSSGYNKTILLSFEYRSIIYHIVSDYTETYLAIRENAELKKVQTLLNSNVLITDETTVTKDGHYVASFRTLAQGRMRIGYIDVFENNIKV